MRERSPFRWPTRALALAALCVGSLGLLNLVDHFAWAMLPWPWVSEVRLPSLLVCLALCLAAGGAQSLAPRTPSRRALIAGAGWLAGAAISFALGASFTRFHGTDLVAFLATGLLGEELLFRGAIYSLALAALPRRRVGPLALAAVLSAAVFSLSHFQYHGWHATPAALAQVGITFPLGLVLGYLRGDSGSLWPPLVVHLLNNLLSQLGR